MLLVYVSLKSLKKASKKVEEYPFFIDGHPDTLRELLIGMVKCCISVYKEKHNDVCGLSPISDEQYSYMEAVGKFAFGVVYNSNIPKEADAINNAIQSFEDGLIRVFKGDGELTDLNNCIDLKDGDRLTFVRMTFLSGSLI